MTDWGYDFGPRPVGRDTIKVIDCAPEKLGICDARINSQKRIVLDPVSLFTTQNRLRGLGADAGVSLFPSGPWGMYLPRYWNTRESVPPSGEAGRLEKVWILYSVIEHLNRTLVNQWLRRRTAYEPHHNDLSDWTLLDGADHDRRIRWPVDDISSLKTRYRPPMDRYVIRPFSITQSPFGAADMPLLVWTPVFNLVSKTFPYRDSLKHHTVMFGKIVSLEPPELIATSEMITIIQENSGDIIRWDWLIDVINGFLAPRADKLPFFKTIVGDGLLSEEYFYNDFAGLRGSQFASTLLASTH